MCSVHKPFIEMNWEQIAEYAVSTFEIHCYQCKFAQAFRVIHQATLHQVIRAHCFLQMMICISWTGSYAVLA